MTPANSSRARHRKTSPRPIQLVAAVVGVVFLLVGALGFVPGVTADSDRLSFAGHQGARLLGVFAVSVLHNLVHIAFGVAGLLMAGTARRAAVYLVSGGAIYLLLRLYGIAIDHDSATNFVPLNTADNWLHLGLGVGMVTLALVVGRAR